MSVSRRDVIKGGGAMLLGLMGAGSVVKPGKLFGAGDAQEKSSLELPWPYKRLNPEAAAEAGYYGYYAGACCYGAFDSIIGELRKEVGHPYTVIPTAMMVYGEGGVASEGALCGALNGAAAAIFLVTGGLDKKSREPAFALIQELYKWYEQEGLPDYRPKKPKFDIVKSVSRSTLCHVSVSRWCKTSKFKAFSNQRSERCGWLTASVAKRTVELLNSYAEKTFKPAHAIAAEAQSCRQCHDQGGAIENTRGMMDCGGCHFTPRSKHPKI
ncbi:MAG TPA: C-GCAxxG-C-C family protein [Syntrophorhabdales bacterium]|nr:C-GCAxxG-C-C family protein [Syntrophorhabdales bacterium]